MTTSTHKKVSHGLCPDCGHYGSDCEGEVGKQSTTSMPIVYVVHIPEREDGIYLFSDRQDADRFAQAAGASAPFQTPLIPGRHSVVDELIESEMS